MNVFALFCTDGGLGRLLFCYVEFWYCDALGSCEGLSCINCVDVLSCAVVDSAISFNFVASRC